MEETIAIISVFGTIPLILFITMFFRYKARGKNVTLVKAMLDKDKEITPDVIKAVGFSAKRSHSDLRTGMILVAIGAATFIFGGMIPEDEAEKVMGGVAMFPLFIGAAYLAFWFIISRKDPE
ncbi:MAG: hypothetical protein COA91_00905 [Robiginitomaculum sp.]|nr:MAG: hypothetical protein COA91_00905 [Robiginitomaculum sp.]